MIVYAMHIILHIYLYIFCYYILDSIFIKLYIPRLFFLRTLQVKILSWHCETGQNQPKIYSSSESSSLLTSDDNLSISIDIEASAFQGVAKSDATTTRRVFCCTHLASTSSPDARSKQVRYSCNKQTLTTGSCLEVQ